MIKRQKLTAMLAITVAVGCGPAVQPLPGHVTPQETTVYKAFLKSYTANHSGEPIYVDSLTHPIHNNLTESCVQQANKDGVKKVYLDHLRSLDEATFPINLESTTQITVGEPPDWSHTAGRRLGLSRVALSRDGNEAYLEFSELKYANGVLDGRGWGLLATRKGSGWSFKSVGCRVIFD